MNLQDLLVSWVPLRPVDPKSWHRAAAEEMFHVEVAGRCRPGWSGLMRSWRTPETSLIQSLSGSHSYTLTCPRGFCRVLGPEPAPGYTANPEQGGQHLQAVCPLK